MSRSGSVVNVLRSKSGAWYSHPTVALYLCVFDHLGVGGHIVGKSASVPSQKCQSSLSSHPLNYF